MSKAKIKKYLRVEGNKVYAKVPCSISLDLTEYKEVDEDYGDKVGVEEIDNVYKIPGFFSLEFPEENDILEFFFPYMIYLHKTDNTIQTSSKIEIEFSEDELIFYGAFKETSANISLLSSMFQNGSKYLGDKPDKLISSLWQQLVMITNVRIHHIEILVSQLYADYDKSKKRVVPLRLTNNAYSKKYIMNLKESAHELNNALGFAYGYSKDALRTSVSQKKKGKNSFFEDIMGSNYDELENIAIKEKKQN